MQDERLPWRKRTGRGNWGEMVAGWRETSKGKSKAEGGKERPEFLRILLRQIYRYAVIASVSRTLDSTWSRGYLP